MCIGLLQLFIRLCYKEGTVSPCCKDVVLSITHEFCVIQFFLLVGWSEGDSVWLGLLVSDFAVAYFGWLMVDILKILYLFVIIIMLIESFYVLVLFLLGWGFMFVVCCFSDFQFTGKCVYHDNRLLWNNSSLWTQHLMNLFYFKASFLLCWMWQEFIP